MAALAACWVDIEGSNEQGMDDHKLHRIENPRWDPPYVIFELERHGATVAGSSRAEVHRWHVNIDTMVAT